MHGNDTHEATADVADRLGSDASVCEPGLRSFGSRRRASGLIACLRVHEDAGLVRDLLATAGEGRILVVDGGGICRMALLGERLARIGLANGWAGVVIHGAVRDAELLAVLPLAVFAIGATPRRASLVGAGERDVVLTFGGIDFRPGDRLWLDADGMVVSAA